MAHPEGVQRLKDFMSKRRKTSNYYEDELTKICKLPIFKGRIKKTRPLTADEYLEFVTWNLKHNFDRRAYAKEKKLSAVNVPFSLK